jgi:hypothetical protein
MQRVKPRLRVLQVRWEGEGDAQDSPKSLRALLTSRILLSQ